jgi:hypothetical protein
MKITEDWIAQRCDDDCGCLIWTKQVSRDGAPVAWTQLDENGKRFKFQVRRAVWEMRNGPIPDDMRVTYKCNNPRCLTCLALASPGEINSRTWSRPDLRAKKVAALTKASRARGKLDMDKARRIRESTETLKKISHEMGISMTLASQVRRGMAWKEGANPWAGLGA